MRSRGLVSNHELASAQKIPGTLVAQTHWGEDTILWSASSPSVLANLGMGCWWLTTILWSVEFGAHYNKVKKTP